MSENDTKGLSVDIPEDAIQEALDSVGKKNQASGDEEAVVEVEVESPGEEGEEPSREELLKEVETHRSEAQAARDRMLRVAADADNTRKRAIKERDEAIKFGQEGLLRELLPALDNLERTLAHIPAEAEDPVILGLKEGLSMILKQFQDSLAKYDLTGFSAVGEMFDPNLHEALNKKETGDTPPGTVLEEMHRGYMLHDRLLRPALVTVACEPGECAKAPQDQDREKEETAEEQTDEEN